MMMIKMITTNTTTTAAITPTLELLSLSGEVGNPISAYGVI